jgi:hypothetical protein
LNNGAKKVEDGIMYGFNNLYDYSVNRGLYFRQLISEQSHAKNNKIYMKDNSGYFKFYELSPVDFKEAE